MPEDAILSAAETARRALITVMEVLGDRLPGAPIAANAPPELAPLSAALNQPALRQLAPLAHALGTPIAQLRMLDLTSWETVAAFAGPFEGIAIDALAANSIPAMERALAIAKSLGSKRGVAPGAEPSAPSLPGSRLGVLQNESGSKTSCVACGEKAATSPTGADAFAPAALKAVLDARDLAAGRAERMRVARPPIDATVILEQAEILQEAIATLRRL